MRHAFLAACFVLCAPPAFSVSPAAKPNATPATTAMTMPVISTLPDFKLTDQNTKAVDLASLRGKVWIADFIYTSCGDECPLMTRKMFGVQKALAGTSDVAFVTFTTDPKRDTAEVLKKYASLHKVEEGNWVFLTGPKKTIVDVSVNGFKLPAKEATVQHSTKFALVDQAGKVRGYYNSSDNAALAKLTADAKALAAEGNSEN